MEPDLIDTAIVTEDDDAEEFGPESTLLVALRVVLKNGVEIELDDLTVQEALSIFNSVGDDLHDADFETLGAGDYSWDASEILYARVEEFYRYE